jgi:hypothetical protein
VLPQGQCNDFCFPSSSQYLDTVTSDDFADVADGISKTRSKSRNFRNTRRIRYSKVTSRVTTTGWGNPLNSWGRRSESALVLALLSLASTNGAILGPCRVTYRAENLHRTPASHIIISTPIRGHPGYSQIDDHRRKPYDSEVEPLYRH